jgi:nitrogen fixation/metabolism regulation signal transduction histidine kinase
MVRMAAAEMKRISFGIWPMLALFLLLLVSLSYMSDATHNSERFGQMYTWLLLVNALGLVLLTSLIGANLFWLVRQQRKKAAGAQLTTRLVIMFVVLAVAPVSVVYYFSLQFLQRGIDSWFDVRVEQALEDSLDLSRSALDVRLRDVLSLTERVAEELAEVPVAVVPLSLYDLRVRSGAVELTLLGKHGRIVGSSSADPTAIVPDQPSEEILMSLRAGSPYVGLDIIGDKGLHVRAVVPVVSSKSGGEQYVLQALYSVSERLDNLATSVQTAFARYKELSYLRTPLKYSYSLTLSLVLGLSLLSAVWGAFYSARRLVAPVRDLAEGTRAVADGDYSRQLPVASEDELGFLVRSFNDMTRRLEKAREQTRRSQRQIERQRAYLEAVLANLSSGVMSIDADNVLRTVNAAATKILGVDIYQYLDADLEAIAVDNAFLSPFLDVMRARVSEHQDAWQEEVIIFGNDGRKILMCRGATLQGADTRAGGQVIVFDDVTALIQAQRDAAWGEVARRLAHEIRNPLTPIQLSAERLRRKYLGTMARQDAEVLDRATRTIVNQVEAMKHMVNDFSEYARGPRVQLESVHLNQLIQEVLDLYRDSVPDMLIVERLDRSEPVIEGDPGRLRQLLHNLIKNAQEAARGRTGAVLYVSTREVGDGKVHYVELCFEDNGPGFQDGMLERLFEPYVSTKQKGTGLGLAIVKKIVEEHGGVIIAENAERGGARISIRFQLAEILKLAKV